MSEADTDASPADVVARFYKCIEAGDWKGVADLYREDVGVWHNSTQRTLDKETALKGFEQMEKLGTGRYTVDERLIFGNRVVQRLRLEMTTHDGRKGEMPIAIFLTVEGGKITRIDEYIELSAFAALREPAAA